MKATLEQAGKILKLVKETEIPLEQLQKLLASGLLSDLLKANIDEVDREVFRKVCGLIPIRVKDLKIATTSFDPITFIGEEWKIIPEDQDEKSVALEEVDFTKVKSVSCLNEGESSIKGEEKLRRLKESSNIRLGATVFMALWNDYQANGRNSILERLYKEEIIGNYIDFFGTILLDPDGNHNVLYLYRHDNGEWHRNVNWLGFDWDFGVLSAVLPQAT